MIRPLRAVALDMGIANVGVAVTHDQAGEPRLACRTITPRARAGRRNLMDHERAHETIGAVMATVACKPDLVIIEKPLVVEGTGDTPIRLAEIHGATKHWLWSKRIPYADVDPHHVKTYATGNGNAKKPDVQAAIIARYGRFLHVHTFDEADAVSLLMMALDAYGSDLPSGADLPEVPASHGRAVMGTTWPLLAVS